jgi:outer membrane protein assembly factor BamA
LAIAWGCGGQLRAQEPGADLLGAIRIAGNRTIETAVLEPALALHGAIGERAAIDPYLLTQDTGRIRAAYLKRGFFDVKVTARVDPGGRPGQVAVFTVVEGRRATTQVEISGLPPELELPRARALVALGDGAPFDYDVYDAAKQPLRALVEDAGYAHADVRATVIADPVAAVAHARYEIVPGVRCTFGEIRFTGSGRAALVEAARTRLRFVTGDRYSVSALDESQVEIYEIGRFSAVQLVPDRSGGATVDVAVELAEANRHEIHGGGGFGIEPATYEPRVRGGGSYVPAALPLLTLAADARVAYTIPYSLDQSQLEPKVRGLVSAQYLDLFRPRLRGEVELGADYQTVEAYTWTGEHVRLGLASPLGLRWLQLRLGWVLEHLTFAKPDLALVSPWDPSSCSVMGPACETIEHALGLDRAQLRGAYQASLVADLRDNAIDPHRGVYLGLPVTMGTPLAGGDLTYVQLTPEVRGYVSLAGTVIAARVRVGAILDDIPVTERYYSGGTSGQRGFSDRRLSPVATMTDGDSPHSVVIGGAGLIETGVELRRELGTLWAVPLGGNLFLDGGDVTRSWDELDPWNLYWAIGGGLWTRLGGLGGLKIRVDLGYRLNDKGPSDPLRATGWWDRVQPHLGVGEAF